MNTKAQKNQFTNSSEKKGLTKGLINSFFTQMNFLPKPISTLILATAAVASLTSAALAQGIPTTPVGFMTYTIAGGSPDTPSYTAISLPLHEIPVYSGVVSAVSDNTISVSSTTWISGAYASTLSPYLVRIRSGAQAGRVLPRRPACPWPERCRSRRPPARPP